MAQQTQGLGLEVLAPFLANLPLAVPTGTGEEYKRELKVFASDEVIIKVNVWSLPDIDRGGQSGPHSHPWPFRAMIIKGGYTEERYWVEDGEVRFEERSYTVGDINEVPLNVYHLVTKVEPGTVTVMILDNANANPGQAWGYLDVETGKHVPVQSDPDFLIRAAQINPWQEGLQKKAQAILAKREQGDS